MEYENKFVGKTYVSQFNIDCYQNWVNMGLALALAPSEIWYS